MSLAWAAIGRSVPFFGEKAGASEFADQRLQMPGVEPPAPDAAGVDRLAHLMPADRAHEPLVFVEAREALLEGQLQEVEHTQQGRVEILDPVGQMQRQDRVRQHRLPVLHQPVLLTDVTAEVGEVVGVGVHPLAAEGEDRQPDVAGIAHAVDDPRARQHKRAEPQVQDVPGHLVDDAPGLRRQGVQRDLHPLRRVIRRHPCRQDTVGRLHRDRALGRHGKRDQLAERRQGDDCVRGASLGELLSSGGVKMLSNGAVASDARVLTGGKELVLAGGGVTGTVLSSGGERVVSAGGSATSISVKGGKEADYGLTSGAVVYSGAIEVGGLGTSGTRVYGGGLEVLSKGSAVATMLTVSGA